MESRTKTCFAWAMVLGIFFSLPAMLVAQGPTDPRFDPSDVYFQAYLEIRSGEQLEKEKDFVGALEKYQRASELFGSVRQFYPDWKTKMVRNRSELTSKALAKVKDRAGKQMDKDLDVIAEFEGGVKSGTEAFYPGKGAVPLDPKIVEVDPLQAKRLREAEAELARLRELVSKADPKTQEAIRNASRVGDLRKQNQSLAAKLNAAEDQVRSLKARMAATPVESELKALNGKISKLEQERDVMGRALRSSREDHTEALAKLQILSMDIEILTKQATELRQNQANLQRDLATEREISNQVVSGQREQLNKLEQALEKKADQLQLAHSQISGLRGELEESRAAFSELREERDGLLQEREQMSALLKINESGRIELLIEQNMGLAKNLREAEEKIDRLNRDNNASKDDVVSALRDLAIAKSRINRLQYEKREQDRRLTELNEKLQEEERALVKGDVNADPEEVKMLRDVIRRQLRIQGRQRESAKLLIEAAKDLGEDDARLKDAIKLFTGSKLQLTPEEQRLVANQEVDGEFISPYARDRETVGRATASLELELDAYERAATKAYLSGRFSPTRELLEMMIEEHPGHVPALCKLGVVQLKLKEPLAASESFQKAVELDNDNPYASRMLGYSYLEMNQLSSARKYLKRAVKLAPDDAKSYLLLGMVCFRLGEAEEAEAQFKGAIAADPIPSEPYFNLALLTARDGRLENAREYYHKALQRGAVPNQNFEAKIAN